MLRYSTIYNIHIYTIPSGRLLGSNRKQRCLSLSHSPVGDEWCAHGRKLHKHSFSPDSWQAIGVLTSQRWGLRWRTFEPGCCAGCCALCCPDVLCTLLSRLRWPSLAKVLWRVLCRVLSRVRWRSLAKVLCRVLCRVFCAECGGEVWQRCCAGCCAECSAQGAVILCFQLAVQSL